MNGRVLFDFMYDQFVWPQYPFASRDVRHKFAEREPQEGSPLIADASASPSALIGEPSRSVIVLADRRRCKEST